jgi:hypothetical protein
MVMQAEMPGPEGQGVPGRVSLRKLDALLQGELPEAEAGALRAALEADPVAKVYLERQAALRSELSAHDLRAAIAKAEARQGVRGLLARLLGSGPGASAARPRRSLSLGIAGASLACLALGLTVWTGDLFRGSTKEAYRAKGTRPAEVMLRLGGRDFAPGDLIPARAGDTLGFSYRADEPVHVQVWYQEDDKEPAPFAGAGGFVLPYASGWTEASRRILLEGAWIRQQVFILVSDRPLAPEAAARAVRRGKGGKDDGVRVLAFRLVAPPKG